MKRGGKWKTLDASELVPGDIVKVTQGDNIPADIRLLELNSISMQVEEAALTGESVSVSKTINVMSESSAEILQE